MSEKLLRQILDELKSVKESQQSMQGDIQSLQGDIQSMQGDIQSMQGDIQSVQGDIQSMQGDIQSMQGDIQSMQGDIQILKDTAVRIEGKQEIIYEHTARLSEYHSQVTSEIENVKDRLDFNTHKITETERELFILKRKN